MASTIDADYLFNITGESTEIPNQVLTFPPIYPTDMASKKYVDSTFLNGDNTGSLYAGTIDFTSTADTPLYQAAFPADAVAIRVNRIGNLVYLRVNALSTTTMTRNGTELIGVGLPQEFWPAPALPRDNGSIYTTPMFITHGATPADGEGVGYLGVGSDGKIRISLASPNNIWYVGNSVEWGITTLVYSAWRGEASVAITP